MGRGRMIPLTASSGRAHTIMSIILLSVASLAAVALVYRQFRKHHFGTQPIQFPQSTVTGASQWPSSQQAEQLAAMQRLSTKVPFGKYKNRPISEMLQDTNYCDWLRDNEDPNRRKQYQSFFKVFDTLSVQLFDENSHVAASADTRLEGSREHNLMQHEFADAAFRKTFAYIALPPQNLRVRLRQFAEYSEKDELPDPATDVRFEYGPQRVDVFFTAEWTWPFYKARIRAFVELKPTLGQDYPHVLRQILNKISEDEPPGEHSSSGSELSLVAYFLLIQRYLPADPPLEFVRRDFFGKHRIRLLLRSDIPA